MITWGLQTVKTVHLLLSDRPHNMSLTSLSQAPDENALTLDPAQLKIAHVFKKCPASNEFTSISFKDAAHLINTGGDLFWSFREGFENTKPLVSPINCDGV